MNDPYKLINTPSISKLLEENRRNFVRFELIDVFTILIPEHTAFDEIENNRDYGKLNVDSDGKPITYDLFADYLQLNRSFWYYEKNVDKDLFITVFSKWMNYEPCEQGGPLFLKLLLDEVRTTGEANLRSLIHILEAYNIKTDCKGEGITKVVALFRSGFRIIKELKKQGGELPDNSVSNLLRVFRTTSVDEFNSQFERLENERWMADIYNSLKPRYPEAMGKTGGLVRANDMESALFILKLTSHIQEGAH
eukprot:jgi/Psemu1/290231/fgenesh1_pg.468_\